MQYIVIIDLQQLIAQTRPHVLDEFLVNAVDYSYLTSWYRWACNHILHRALGLHIIGHEDVATYRNVYNQVEKMFSGQFFTCISHYEAERLAPDLSYQTVFTGQELILVSCKEV